MKKPELTALPKLAAGVRLNDKSQLPRKLLAEGREIRLSGPSLEMRALARSGEKSFI